MNLKKAYWLALVASISLFGCSHQTSVEQTEALFPVEYYSLANGLKVVLSKDSSSPIATVAVYYQIGFRNEPKGRTGFAHLFEHLMFQGSEQLGKMEFISLVNGSGGVVNGSTRFDFTNYFETVPNQHLDKMLWAEADRMRGLVIDEANLQNQKDVVKNEVFRNVINQPYGGFPWLELPQHAFDNWYNAHNFYGELDDLQAATLEEAYDFFNAYYVPNNAVLVVVGDFKENEVKKSIAKYFSAIPAGNPVLLPDVSEQPQIEERRAVVVDEKAPQPALAIGYRMPEKGSKGYFAMGLINQIILQGRDSRLHQKLVNELKLTDRIGGGINDLGNMFNYDGPMLWSMSTIYPNDVSFDQLLTAIDAEMISLSNSGVTTEELNRARIKMKSSYYDLASSATKFGIVDLLASFALFDDNPDLINEIEKEFDNVTEQDIIDTARRYLIPSNRTILEWRPQS